MYIQDALDPETNSYIITNMSIKDDLEKGMEDTNPSRGLDFFKFVDGDNRIRILSEGFVIAQHFFGKGIQPSVCYGISKGCPFHKETDKPASVKYSCYILDRADNVVKLADLPYSVIKKVSDLQLDSEWAFDTFPMPYDIKVTFKKDESPANMYSVIGSPKREELPAETVKTLDDLMKNANPGNMVENKKSKQLEDHKQKGIWLDPSKNLSEEDKQKIQEARNREIDASDSQDDEIKGGEIPW